MNMGNGYFGPEKSWQNFGCDTQCTSGHLVIFIDSPVVN